MDNLLCKRNCILGYETHLYLLKFIKKNLSLMQLILWLQ